MATVYQNEVDINTPYSTYNVDLSGTLDTQFNGVSGIIPGTRVLFNGVTLNNTAQVTAYYVNTFTAGATLSSGSGAIVYDNAYNGSTFYLILSDRSSYYTSLSGSAQPGTSYTLILSSNGYNAWGPTERRLRLLEYI
jgi:hypothetical protein